MNKSQMQSLVTAITNAGFPATVTTTDNGLTWKVRSKSKPLDDLFDVNVNTVKNLADSQGVIAKVMEVEYS